ncbi:hypothetical protein VTK26DRAFT_5637 [Humicola hyalothermophila]
MSPPKEDDITPTTPKTPRRIPTAKNGNATTPTNKRASAPAGATPKSAPAAAAHGSSQKKKPEPTLLGDFFLGRQSPARVAAQRQAMKQRRKSMADAANVREELRQEMRAAAIRRLQQPGGVTERVKAWQKANAAAMKQCGGGVPRAEDVASEPTEVAAHIAPESVTEEDRIRIKLRHKPTKKKAQVDKSEDKENHGAEDGEDSEREKTSGSASRPPVVKAVPKKRIVSDDNWMKRRQGRSPPRGGPAKPQGNPTPIPKDFLQRTARNPTVQSKIKDWVERVEIPDPPPVKEYRHKKPGAKVTAEEDTPSVVSSEPEIGPKPKPPTDDGIRVKATRPKTSKSSKPEIRPKPKPPADDGIRVKPTASKSSQSDADDGIRVKPARPKTPKPDTDDGIRIIPAKVKEPPDDGIRVRPVDTKVPDDGIRVRPIDSPLQDDDTRIRPRKQVSVAERTSRPSAPRPASAERARVPSTKRDPSPDDVIEVIEEPETEVQSPPRKKASRRRSRRRRSPSPVVQTVEPPEHQHSESEKTKRMLPQDTSDTESERIPPTVLGNKPLAEIPFGYSAFSVLDLPLGADAQNSTKKTKTQRNQSFIKKVVTGAKEIIQERAEPPRPVGTNKPQSIESWLNNTVDPFVESTAKPSTTAEKEQKPQKTESSKQVPAPDSQEKPQTNPPPEAQQRKVSAAAAHKKSASTDSSGSAQEDSDATPKKAKAPATPSTELKRRRATRMAASPAKSGGKMPFRDFLKSAFKGESVGPKLPPMVYPSCEANPDDETYYEEDDWETTDEPSRYTDPGRRPASPDYSTTYDSTLSSDISSAAPPRRRPPTSGAHKLSTIVSQEPSTVGSETLSDVSQTTITQTTAFTKATELSRQKSQKPGLKRRLTKHSDLVSVLSLPDNGKLVPPSRSRSIKSPRSLHRRPSRADRDKADELLDEFADDEHFYGRELKTLVDGVIPVLLKDLMAEEAKSNKANPTAKSVVNMGMALEKLRDFHRRVPLGDIGELLFWMDDVSPVYDNYLSVWRLGFQGLIINLAPRQGRFDDNDSLLDALPLNEDGDVIGEDGERVDVAFLLKRPLIRVKWMVRFLRAAVAVTGTAEAERLLSVFEALQEKARKRHREETARMMDEDANNTDTTRCRDLRNLMPLEGIMMNRARQVAALDVFALDLCHSSGQRLECQVELIFRDNPAIPGDRGDILIREIGDNTRSWLLFPPVPRQNISAKRDGDNKCLIVMIRGTHNGNEWFELLKFSTTCEDQIDYWLDVLGSNPMPPTARTRPNSMVLEPAAPLGSDGADIPVGERRRSVSIRNSLGSDKSSTPPSTNVGQHDGPSAPPSPSPAAPVMSSPNQTPAEDGHAGMDRRRPSWEIRTVDTPKIVRPPPNSTPWREDGAPPPPIHRTLGPKSPGLLAPPIDPGRQLRRRMSSPLKHEYHPSDVSSDSSSTTIDDDESESSQSSSDELDEDEVPDTIPGYSIKEDEVPPVESVVSDLNSITPSHSASQAGIANHGSGKPERPAQTFTASVSYWSSRKGLWKDINGGQPASIVVHPGCMEVHHVGDNPSNRQAYPLQSSGTSEVDNSNKDAGSILPLILLVLTPVVMIRRSTALDLEVRSPASPESRLKIEAGMFRFRAANQVEAKDLYEAVHVSRLNNARYIQLAEEARVRSFGQMQAAEQGDGSADGSGSGRRHSFFGRKNSYRASTRAPSVSQGSMSTTISAGSFLRRLMGGGNNSFNIDESSLDRRHHHDAPTSRPGSAGGPGGPGGGGSLYTSSGSGSPPRSLSISLSGSGQSRWSNGLAKPFSPGDGPLEIRCHLNVQNNRWLDKGDCVLQICRPPPGVRQELPLYHGLEKRVIVLHATKKAGDRPLILLDAVLGSKCFSLLGRKGVMCSVWENLRDEEGRVGVAPREGAIAGRVTKWCFQCKSSSQADWIMKLLTSEVEGLV